MESHILNPNTQATLLLTSRLRQSAQHGVAPLRPSEFLGIAMALRRMGLQPADLFDDQNLARVCASGIPNVERIEVLLSRGLALAMALENWSAQGIWVIGWDDMEYPHRYKQRLKGQSPPILYGLGERSLLQNGGLAIVGSRDVDEAGIAFTHSVAESCADEGLQVISGAARGVDIHAMLSCVEHGGQAVGILSDSLARQAVSSRFRDAVVSGNLMLVSPFEPEARFYVASAMARNKLVYALADHALVVSSDHKKGGTWAGAVENLEKGWVPLFVRSGNDVPAGNAELLDAGAIPLDMRSVPIHAIGGWMQQQSALHGAHGSAISESQKPTQGTLPLF